MNITRFRFVYQTTSRNDKEFRQGTSLAQYTLTKTPDKIPTKSNNVGRKGSKANTINYNNISLKKLLAG